MKRQLGRFFDTDTRRFTRNIALLQVGVVITLPLNIVQSIVLARALGPAGLGIIVPIVALVRMVSQLCDAGSGHLIVLFGPRYRQRPDDPRLGALIKAAALLSVATGLLTAVISWTAIWLLQRYGWRDATVSYAAWYLAAAAIVGGLDGITAPVLRLTGRFGAVSAIRIASACASLCIISGTAIVTKGPAAVIMAYAAADVVLTIIGCACVAIVLSRHEGISLRRAPLQSLASDWREMRRYVALTWCSSSGMFAYGRTDEFIASFVAPPDAIGFYKIAKNGVSVVKELSDAILDTAYVEIAALWASMSREKLRTVAHRVTIGGAAFATVALAGVALLGHEVIVALYGYAYSDAFDVLKILILSTLCLPGLWLFPLMRAAGKLHILIGFEVAASVISVATMIAAGSYWGIAGLAGGHVLFDVALVVTTGIYAARRRTELFGQPSRDRRAQRIPECDVPPELAS